MIHFRISLVVIIYLRHQIFIPIAIFFAPFFAYKFLYDKLNIKIIIELPIVVFAIIVTFVCIIAALSLLKIFRVEPMPDDAVSIREIVKIFDADIRIIH